MDRRTLLAVALCFLIFMGWQKYYIEPRMPHATAVTQTAPQTGEAPTATQAVTAGRPDTAQNAANISNPATLSTAPAVKSGTPAAPFESRSIKVSTGTALIGNGPKIFTGWDLTSYRLGLAPETAAVDMKSTTNLDTEGEVLFDHPELAYLSSVAPQNFVVNGNTVTWTYEDDKVKLVREITSNENQPYVDLKITADFKKVRANYMFVSLGTQGVKDEHEAADRNFMYWTNQSVEKVHVKDLKLQEVATPVKWIGATTRYFVMTLVNQAPTEPRALIQPSNEIAGKISLVYPISGTTITVPLRAYFGPKEINLLRSVDPTLDHTVDFGWFTIFAYPLLRLMKWLYGIFGNYGVAIILLTVLIKLLTYPLTYKSMKSMKKMAALQPQLAKLKEKYKDDKEALNREMLTLMRGKGYNPIAGCLPIIIQMPVFFALYRVLYSSIELYHAPFAFWIMDLSYKDPFYVTPVLLSATMFLQQKLTPTTATDPAQQKMMQFMPLIFGGFMISLPSGLTLYMLVNAIMSILQQLFLNKRLDGGASVPSTARAK
ncbi:MAG: membrane protein insertase YidC [Methylotenera sp.]|nr:membrane protein insertase YidC [Oligoflexia bacterium]